MKKTIYFMLLACGMTMTMSSCASHEEYDAYVAKLTAQSEAVDTISTRASYAAYLDALSESANVFDQLGIKLDPEQKAQLATLSDEIQTKLTAKYEQLANQSEAVCEADGVSDEVVENCEVAK